MQQATLAIIKPDAIKKNIIGQIVRRIEENDLAVVAMKMVHLSRKMAESFYYVHRERPFFASLTQFMSEAPVVLMVLRGENAISRWRDIMGATDPAKAKEGTIRKLFGESIERNAVHGSDGPESAGFEIGYFFSAVELVR
ncbi:MAG: nucleoside-diphosphate kinase [Acidobacteria bacterium]|nr:nucleoside-diphosphate kinase [Acidobacteriota bacterium]